MSISAVIITLNEEQKIADCIGSVKWTDEIVVVDGFSSDKTREVARNHGAKVYEREFDDFASQKNYAIEKATGEYIFFLDADERAEESLAAEILKAVIKQEYQGYYIPRKNIIFGREMKYGGHQGDKHLRLFKKDVSHFVDPIHEKVVVNGNVGMLSNFLIHYSTASISEYRDKMDLYTELEVKHLVQQNVKLGKFDKAWKPIVKFFKQYFMQKGFLDGKEGLVFYYLSAVYLYTKYDKYWKITKNSKVEQTKPGGNR
ncbi:MAG: glycosyltransferase family 2 protein [Candidatus Omnitrophota bacterium]